MLNLLNQIIKSNIFLRIESFRCYLKKSDVELVVSDYGAGSLFNTGVQRAVSNIMRKSCSPLLKTFVINYLIQKYKCLKILELGTCLGINALHIARANPLAHIVSVDADRNLIRYARKMSQLIGIHNVVFLHSLFDDVLEDLLLSFKPNFIFIDGNHRYDATLRYFDMICNRLEVPVAVLVDDINWSKGMKKAWKELSCHRIKEKKKFLGMGLILLH